MVTRVLNTAHLLLGGRQCVEIRIAWIADFWNHPLPEKDDGAKLERVDNQNEFQQKYHRVWHFFEAYYKKQEHQLAVRCWPVLRPFRTIWKGNNPHELGTFLITHSCSNYLLGCRDSPTPHSPFPYHKNPLKYGNGMAHQVFFVRNPEKSGGNLGGCNPKHQTNLLEALTTRNIAGFFKELLRIQVPNMECFCLDFMRPWKTGLISRWVDWFSTVATVMGGAIFFPVEMVESCYFLFFFQIGR